MKNKLIFITMAVLLSINTAISQIPVEAFIGYDRSTIDIMFFKFIKKHNDQNSRILFFNRNRASIQTQNINNSTPLFGFTEAISYNHEKLKGFAPVLVGQVLSYGVYIKSGIQYAKINTNSTLFSWLVIDLNKQPYLDYFIMYRYSPIINKIKLFTQIELINNLGLIQNQNHQLTQRIRIGLYCKSLQFGAGIDINQVGRKDMSLQNNPGIFIRNEF